MQRKGKSMEIILSPVPNICFGRKVYIGNEIDSIQIAVVWLDMASTKFLFNQILREIRIFLMKKFYEPEDFFAGIKKQTRINRVSPLEQIEPE